MFSLKKLNKMDSMQFFMIILGLLVFFFILKGFGCSREGYSTLRKPMSIDELVNADLCKGCEQQYNECAARCDDYDCLRDCRVDALMCFDDNNCPKN